MSDGARSRPSGNLEHFAPAHLGLSLGHGLDELVRKRQIGDIGREIGKTRQAHRLLHEIGRVGQKQSGENEPREGLPGALAPAAPNYRKSQ